MNDPLFGKDIENMKHTNNNRIRLFLLLLCVLAACSACEKAEELLYTPPADALCINEARLQTLFASTRW